MHKKIFSIEWPGDYDKDWMSIGNLLMCLSTEQHVGPGIQLTIKDITIPPPEPQPTLGGHDL